VFKVAQHIEQCFPLASDCRLDQWHELREHIVPVHRIVRITFRQRRFCFIYCAVGKRDAQRCRCFGELDIHILRQFTHKDHATVSIISNMEDRKANVNDVSLNWHTDLAYRKRPSAFVTLYADVVPEEGADTRFAAVQRVYRDMSDDEKNHLRGRRATYSFLHLHSQRPDPDPLTPEQLAESADVHHPLLRRHPDTGEEILYVNLPDCIGVSGLEKEEALKTIRSLYDRITDPANTIGHKWTVGDLVIWDNRTLMHSATYFDDQKYKRRMLRTVVRGEEPMPSTLGASVAAE